MELYWRSSRKKKLRAALDLVLTLLSFILVSHFDGQGALPLVSIPSAVYTLSAFILLRGFEMYAIIPLQKNEIIVSLALTCLYASAITLCASLLPICRVFAMPIRTMLACSGSSFAAQLSAHLSYKYYLEHRQIKPRLLILDKTGGDFSRLKRLRYTCTKAYDSWYEQLDMDDPAAVAKSIRELLPQFDSLCLLEGIGNAARKEYIQAAMKLRIELFVVPAHFDMIYSKIHLVYFDDVLGLCMHPYRLSNPQACAKRLMDLTVVAPLLAIAVLPMLIIALVVFVTSPGPVFYTQERLTKDKRVFKIIKFRTMTVDAEQSTGPVFAAKNDPRVTAVGSFLRRCRLDELPQLFNVLLGHMSLVGPRPERPFFVEQFEREIEHYNHRFVVKSGLTSLSHVYGRYSTDIRDRTRYDLLYISNYSWVSDLKILLQTSRVIFLPHASDGLEPHASSNSVPLRETAAL